MKKKLLITTSVIVLITALGIGIYHSDASQSEPRLSIDEVKQLVTDQYPGTVTDIDMEKDFNRVVYEIDVISDGNEYELKIDGNSGEVLKLKAKGLIKKDQMVIDDQGEKEQAKDPSEKKPEKTESNDKKDESNNQDNKEQKTENEPKVEKPQQEPEKEPVKKPEKKTVIDRETAINIALQEFPGEVTDFELDEEDGRLIYEIEIESNKGEAEFEIDAYTGEIIVIEIDLDD